MKFIGLSLRVELHQYKNNVERRDSIDQQWIEFFKTCGLIPILLPNHLTTVDTLLKKFNLDGIVLTGGNNPVKYGGDAPERDCVDQYLIDWSIINDKPLIGVCRGMQSIQLAYKNPLAAVDGHVSSNVSISLDNDERIVNSYHSLGTVECSSPIVTKAKSKDGVIKAIKHESECIYGMMWHPERNIPFEQVDIDFFIKVFNKGFV